MSAVKKIYTDDELLVLGQDPRGIALIRIPDQWILNRIGDVVRYALRGESLPNKVFSYGGRNIIVVKKDAETDSLFVTCENARVRGVMARGTESPNFVAYHVADPGMIAMGLSRGDRVKVIAHTKSLPGARHIFPKAIRHYMADLWLGDPNFVEE